MDEAELAGLRVMEVRDHTDRLAAAALLSAIWGVPPTESPVPADMMVALTHAGGCVLGAWTADDTLVGVAIGLAGAPRSEQVYSYIAGVAKGAAGIGVGRRLKLAQRDWALRQGATSLIWTYDPLIRRNAHFNLNRLGAAVTGAASPLQLGDPGPLVRWSLPLVRAVAEGGPGSPAGGRGISGQSSAKDRRGRGSRGDRWRWRYMRRIRL